MFIDIYRDKETFLYEAFIKLASSPYVTDRYADDISTRH